MSESLQSSSLIEASESVTEQDNLVDLLNFLEKILKDQTIENTEDVIEVMDHLIEQIDIINQKSTPGNSNNLNNSS